MIFFLCLSCVATAHAESPQRIALQPYIGKLKTIDVSIAGNTYPFLFDTGGGFTVITPELAKKIPCTPFGRVFAHRMNGDPALFQNCGKAVLQIGEASMEKDLFVFDLLAILPKGVPPVWGIISLHTLKQHPFTIELAADEITIETEASLKLKTGKAMEIPVRVSQPSGGAAFDLFISVDGKSGPLWLELDSGNLDDVLLAPHAWNELTNAESEEAEIEITLTGSKPETMRARKKDLIYDGALNAAFFEQYVITFDLRAGRMWIRKAVSTK